MFKRIVFLMILLTLAFGISLCHAESWEQVDTNLWIDIDSIQVEPHGLIKAIAREYLQDNIYYSMVLLVDKNRKKYCYESIECHNMTEKHLGYSK